MKDNYLIILFWTVLFWICIVIIITELRSISDQIDTLNDNTELLINRTELYLLYYRIKE